MKNVDTEKVHQQAIHTIILADDDADDHLIFRDALKQVDPTKMLTIVNDGAELLSLLTHFAPDFIFLDLDMPSKNGLECLNEIRKNPLFENLPVVVYSSTSRQNNIDVAYEMGADLFFVKSHSYNALVSAIQEILSFDWNNRAIVKQRFMVDNKFVPFTIAESE